MERAAHNLGNACFMDGAYLKIPMAGRTDTGFWATTQDREPRVAGWSAQNDKTWRSITSYPSCTTFSPIRWPRWRRSWVWSP